MRIVAILAALAAASLSFGQNAPQYPEGVSVPRYMTPQEQRWVQLFGFPSFRVSTPPEGEVRCVAEYEPMEGILVSWEGGTSENQFLVDIIRAVTGPVGQSTVYVVVDDNSEQATVNTRLVNEGIDMSKIKFVVVPTDSVWMRDYGPRYILQGGKVRAIVNHTYNRPRPLDNAFNGNWATIRKQSVYDIPLIHGGGNYHLDALGNSYATRLINNENPGLTEAQIVGYWLQYQNVTTTLFDPFPTSVDATQHLDMWMQVVGDHTVVISSWANNPGSVQDVICNNAASFMAARGYQVFRTPARLVSGVHYTYTNVVMCNNVVVIPSYTNGSVSPLNASALATWQQACPGKTVMQVNAQGIINLAGAMHCVVMHVPKPVNNDKPSVYLTNVNDREVHFIGSQWQIRWVSDDDKGVTSCDLLISRGSRQYETLATGLPANGSYTWTVTGPATSLLQFRVVAHDADGNTGIDDSRAVHNVRENH
jgi:agmatine deiminase